MSKELSDLIQAVKQLIKESVPDFKSENEAVTAKGLTFTYHYVGDCKVICEFNKETCSVNVKFYAAPKKGVPNNQPVSELYTTIYDGDFDTKIKKFLGNWKIILRPSFFGMGTPEGMKIQRPT